MFLSLHAPRQRGLLLAAGPARERNFLPSVTLAATGFGLCNALFFLASAVWTFTGLKGLVCSSCEVVVLDLDLDLALPGEYV